MTHQSPGSPSPTLYHHPPAFPTNPARYPSSTTRTTQPIHDTPSPSAYAHIDVSHVRQIPGQESEPFGYGPSLPRPQAGNGGIAIRYIHADAYVEVYKGAIVTHAQSVLSKSLYVMETGHPDRIFDVSATDSCSACSINDPLDDNFSLNINRSTTT